MTSGNDEAPWAIGLRSAVREVDALEIAVRGDLPPWLAGTLLRVAPARFEVGAQSYRHWFDGLAMLHRFDIAGGRVTYASRFLRSASFEEAKARGGISRGEFATDPCRSLFGRTMAVMLGAPPTDNGVVAIDRIGEAVVALTETRLPVVFDPETLETLGNHAYEADVDRATTTAHPHRDGARAYTYLTRFGRRSVYRLIVQEGARETTLVEIPVERPAYMHSFGMSAKSLVLVEGPLVVDPLLMMLVNAPFIQNFRWRPERGTLVRAFDKETGAERGVWRLPALFSFHHVNAFEAERALVVDLVAYDDARVIDELYLDRLRREAPPTIAGRLVRLTLPTDGGEPDVRVLSDTPIELPRIDYERRAGEPYRIVWGASASAPGAFLDTLARIDLSEEKSGNARLWHEPGTYPGEPVFVPRPGGRGEDDGVLLSVVLDTRTRRSFLLVLDAARMTEIARAETPEAITLGFHGTFLHRSG